LIDTFNALSVRSWATAEGFVDFLDRQHMAEQRGHIDRAVCNHPHGIPERLEPWLALSAEGRVAASRRRKNSLNENM
jgi:hypothetical protein